MLRPSLVRRAGAVLLAIVVVMGIGTPVLAAPAAVPAAPAAVVDCAPTSPTPPSATPPVVKAGVYDGVPLSAAQVGSAATIVSVARSMQVTRRGARVALAVALQESSLNPTAVRDSYVGLFQQKADRSSGLYTQYNRADATGATRMFLEQLIRRVPKYDSDPRADWEIGEVVQETNVGRNVLQWFGVAQQLNDTFNPAVALALPPVNGSTALTSIRVGTAITGLVRPVRATTGFANNSWAPALRQGASAFVDQIAMIQHVAVATPAGTGSSTAASTTVIVGAATAATSAATVGSGPATGSSTNATGSGSLTVVTPAPEPSPTAASNAAPDSDATSNGTSRVASTPASAASAASATQSSGSETSTATTASSASASTKQTSGSETSAATTASSAPTTKSSVPASTGPSTTPTSATAKSTPTSPAPTSTAPKVTPPRTTAPTTRSTASVTGPTGGQIGLTTVPVTSLTPVPSASGSTPTTSTSASTASSPATGHDSPPVVDTSAPPVATGTGDDPGVGSDPGQTDNAPSTPNTDPPAVTALTAAECGGTDVRSTTFDPGMIISDAVFYNSTAMTAAQIRTFINTQGSACTGPYCLKNIRLNYASSVADRYCARYQGGQNEDVATVLTKMSIACGINPQVMLVTLQKESALLTRTQVTASSYDAAYGWHCPDSGPGGSANCDPQYAGFVNQAAGMAKQWARYRLDPQKYNYRAGQTVNILWNVAESNCGGSNVYIRNTATASLYDYTPYQPNAASLAAYPGVGDKCSSYGNRNFFFLFQKYFGSTGGGAAAGISVNGVNVTIPTSAHVAAGAAGQVIKAPSAAVAKGLAAGFAAVGLPYVYGGGTAGGPADQGCARAGGASNSCQGIVGFDCSGLTGYVLSQAGFHIPDYSGAQRASGKSVPWAQGMPGDIIGYNGHVAIYLGLIGGTPYLLEAPDVGMFVQIRPVYYSNGGVPVDSVLHRYWG